jgi:hypothetical protein
MLPDDEEPLDPHPVELLGVYLSRMQATGEDLRESDLSPPLHTLQHPITSKKFIFSGTNPFGFRMRG